MKPVNVTFDLPMNKLADLVSVLQDRFEVEGVSVQIPKAELNCGNCKATTSMACRGCAVPPGERFTVVQAEKILSSARPNGVWLNFVLDERAKRFEPTVSDREWQKNIQLIAQEQAQYHHQGNLVWLRAIDRPTPQMVANGFFEGRLFRWDSRAAPGHCIIKCIRTGHKAEIKTSYLKAVRAGKWSLPKDAKL